MYALFFILLFWLLLFFLYRPRRERERERERDKERDLPHEKEKKTTERESECFFREGERERERDAPHPPSVRTTTTKTRSTLLPERSGKKGERDGEKHGVSGIKLQRKRENASSEPRPRASSLCLPFFSLSLLRVPELHRGPRDDPRPALHHARHEDDLAIIIRGRRRRRSAGGAGAGGGGGGGGGGGRGVELLAPAEQPQLGPERLPREDVGTHPALDRPDQRGVARGPGPGGVDDGADAVGERAEAVEDRAT